MDAGFTLARAHYIPMVLMWLGFSLPIFILCIAIQFWTGWGFMLIIWWWFKPLYELPILFFLSRALFSEHLSIKQAWVQTLRHFWTLFKTYLTLARLSTARSVTYSVVFLEMLPRKKRSTRIQTLTAVKTRHYLLMLACLHIEFILAYAIITLVGALFFASAIADIDWTVFFESVDQPAVQNWMTAASITTLIAAALVAPFYVAGGFLIYINRRMQLEAWDIEHRFRRFKIKTLQTGAIAGVLVVALFFSAHEPAIADDRVQNIMSPTDAYQTITNILEHEDFGSTKTQLVPRNKNPNKDDENSKPDLSFLEWFANSASSLATAFKVILWVVVAIFLGLLIYTLFQFKQSFTRPSALSRHRPEGEDAQSHPLTQDLPTDIVGEAERLLNDGHRRQALSVLFRGALRSVMDEHELKIASGATETDCQTTVTKVATEQQSNTFTRLLSVWQREAYANQPQPEESIRTLINDWKSAFAQQRQTNNGPIAS